ncbi:hypothetical protein Barb6_01852 [Bacteroidales bacterium Barb6]|nr:hypothetical protein Barb6_01852 [Bacteroidales bacterium Barb6]
MKTKHLLTLAALCLNMSVAATAFYVKEFRGSDDFSGTSWNTAFATLYKALSVADHSDVIYMAQGYYQTYQLGSYQISKNLTIIGGYDGTEDPGAKPTRPNTATVLYGRKEPGANNRVLTIAGTGENTLVRVNLECLTIYGGNAESDFPDIISTLYDARYPDVAFGGGICCLYAALTLRDVIIDNNITSGGSVSSYGGGIYSKGSELTLTGNTVIRRNTASDGGNADGHGGGIANLNGKIVLAENTIIENNQATTGSGSGSGGGIEHRGARAQLIASGSIIGNTAVYSSSDNRQAGKGGGIANIEGGQVELTQGAVIENNKVTNSISNVVSACGGGIYNDESSALKLNTADTEVLVAHNITSDNPLNLLAQGNDFYPDAFTCTVIFPKVSGRITADREGRSYQLSRNGTFSFAVTAAEEYDYIIPIVTVNNIPLAPIATEGRTYRYSLMMTENKTINIVSNYHSVIFAAPPKEISIATYQLESPYHVLFNDLFDFTLITSDRFKYVEPIVTVGGNVLKPTGREGNAFHYSLRMTGDVLVKVSEGNFPLISFPSVLPRTISQATVEPGEHYYYPGSVIDFTVTVAEPYKGLTPIVVAGGSNTLLPAVAGGNDSTFHYVLTVTQDSVIRITDRRLVFSNPPQGLDLVSHRPGVNYVSTGDNVYITLTSKDGMYRKVPPIIVAGGDTLNVTDDDDGAYTAALFNITEDRVVNLSLPPHYLMTLRPLDDISPDLAGGTYGVLPGNSIHFDFTLKETYSRIEPVVLVNNIRTKAIYLGSGRYRISLTNVTENKLITVGITDAVPPLPDSAVKIYSRNNLLVIESPAGEVPVTVYTLAGRAGVQRTASGTESIALPNGIYIVKAGTERRKVMINGER